VFINTSALTNQPLRPEKLNSFIYKLSGHIFFLILFILAGSLAMERILYADSAFQLFKIVNFEKFNIEAGRYSTAFSQIIPLLALKSGAGLKFVILLYSVSFICIYYIVYIICVYAFKDTSAGILILFTLLAGIRSSFFHPVTETHQALVYCVLFYGWFFYPQTPGTNHSRKILSTITGLPIILLCYFSHPVTFLVLLYITGYEIAAKRGKMEFRTLFLILFVILLYFMKFITTPGNTYEGQYFSIIRLNSVLPGDISDFDSIGFFVQNLGRLYYLHLLIILVVVGFYFLRRRYIQIIYYLSAILIFFLVTAVIYQKGDSPMSMEKNFMPMNLFVCLPFVREILFENRKNRVLKYIIVLSFLTLSIFNIIRESGIYTQRLDYLKKILSNAAVSGERKFLVEKQDVDMERLIIPWAVSVETLLYSSMESPDHSATIYISEDFGHFIQLADKPGLFLCTDFWLEWDITALNKNYFRMPEERYRLLTGGVPVY
jgi:hypothetical protein